MYGGVSQNCVCLISIADEWKLQRDALSVQYVQECLSGRGDDAPVVIGGVVQVQLALQSSHHS